MTHVRDSKVRYMISPEEWETISPRRNAVTIITQIRRRKMNTLWSASDHGTLPMRTVPAEGIA
jgi:hypothetical protein